MDLSLRVLPRAAFAGSASFNTTKALTLHRGWMPPPAPDAVVRGGLMRSGIQRWGSSPQSASWQPKAQPGISGHHTRCQDYAQLA